MQPTEEQIVAIHEAGHAAMAAFLGVEVLEATIVPRNGFVGVVTVVEDSPPNAWKRVLVSISGHLAEAIETFGPGRFTLETDWLSRSDGDCRNAVSAARELARGSSVVTVLNAAAYVANQFLSLRDVWAAVTALAAALLNEKTLSAQTINTICRSNFVARYPLADLFGPLGV